MSPATPGPGPSLVIDTNWVLDLWVFNDPRADGLRQALQTGRWHWLACPPMRDELARVLGYPLVQRRLARDQRPAQAVLDTFDALTQALPTPARSPWRCADPDDQVFIDLAWHTRAPLLSKDHAVLATRRRMATGGVPVWSEWPGDPVGVC